MSTTTDTTTGKPKKPFPSFPLTPHRSGWVKKINGKVRWFGAPGDPDGALERYHREAKELHAGRERPADANRVTVRDIINRYLGARAVDVQNGLIKPGIYGEYKRALGSFAKSVGDSTIVADLRADDFSKLRGQLESRLGAHKVNNSIQRVRSCIAYAVDHEWCDPVRFGREFKKVPKRKVRAAGKVRLFEVAECQRLIAGSTGQLHAMILLAMNGGMGQSDIATLTVGDVREDVIEVTRPKTNVQRTIPLWQETIDSIKPFLKDKEPGDLIFRTEHGNAWVRETAKIKGGSIATVTSVDGIGQEFGRLLGVARRGTGMAMCAKGGRSFYTLRRTFRTIADDQGDQRAIAVVMGHAVDAADMGAVYVQRISRGRLENVTNHVREVLFSKSVKRTETDRPKGPARRRGKV